MKIRTDFVTNSSSSSFSIVVAIQTKDGRRYSFEEDPYEYNVDSGGEVSFYGEIEELVTGKRKKLKAKYSSVEKLAEFLMNGICDDIYDDFYDEYDESGEEHFSEIIKKRKEEFIQEAVKNISSVKEISKISIRRDYSAWGEFADLIPDNDSVLCSLAKKVTKTTGEKQKEALTKMRECIKSSDGKNRQGEDFACGYEDIRYKWEGDDEKLIALAERLCSMYGPDMCEGREIQEINIDGGSIVKYAEFDLC